MSGGFHANQYEENTSKRWDFSLTDWSIRHMEPFPVTIHEIDNTAIHWHVERLHTQTAHCVTVLDFWRVVIQETSGYGGRYAEEICREMVMMLNNFATKRFGSDWFLKTSVDVDYNTLLVYTVDSNVCLASALIKSDIPFTLNTPLTIRALRNSDYLLADKICQRICSYRPVYRSDDGTIFSEINDWLFSPIINNNAKLNYIKFLHVCLNRIQQGIGGHVPMFNILKQTKLKETALDILTTRATTSLNLDIEINDSVADLVMHWSNVHHAVIQSHRDLIAALYTMHFPKDIVILVFAYFTCASICW